jgi:cell division septal protein FtsQ
VARWLPSARSLLAGAAIVVAAVGMYAIARETSVFAVQRIEVVGGSPRVAGAVRAALQPIVGTSLVAFDAREANRRLADVPDVASATFDRTFPHTLVVAIETEQPVALLRRGREAWLVSGAGRVLRQIVGRPFPSLPRVWISPATDPLVGAVLDGDAGLAVRTVVPMRRAGLEGRARSVRAVDGELSIALDDGTEVLLGDATRLRLKLAAATRIIPQLVGEAYLDVSVPERAVAGTADPTTLNSQLEP